MENTVSRGHAEFGPEQMLPADLGLDELLAGEADGFWETVHSASSSSVPDTAKVVAPIDSQDVWAAGVTYAPSRDARMSESPQHASVYDSVFGAMRPELFYKSSGERVRGPDEEIAVRSDSTWNVPEPELALVLAADCNIVAVTIGNDVSSRSIEGANPLYLPQAKIYEGSCALGPCLVREPGHLEMGIELQINRSNMMIFREVTNTSAVFRPFRELAHWLGRALTFPVGAFLLTGTGIIPPPEFSLCANDLVVITIEGIGQLANPVQVLECGDPPADEAIHSFT